MDHFLSIELKSAAYGYRTVNDLPLSKDCQLVEAALLNKGIFWIFLTGEPSTLQKLSQGIDQNGAFFRKMTLLTEVDPAVKSGLYSLQQEKVGEFLAVVETDSVSDLLEVAHHATAAGEAKVIELSHGRGMDGLCLGYFTGQNPPALTAVLEKYRKKRQLSHFEIIFPVTEALADYFNIENL